jgi:hypothetical protein
MVLGIALLAFVIVQLVLLGVTAAFNPKAGSAGVPRRIMEQRNHDFGMVVVVFAILQYFDVRPETKGEAWDRATCPKSGIG